MFRFISHPSGSSGSRLPELYSKSETNGSLQGLTRSDDGIRLPAASYWRTEVRSRPCFSAFDSSAPDSFLTWDGYVFQEWAVSNSWMHQQLRHLSDMGVASLRADRVSISPTFHTSARYGIA
jgi:hypothetical protein